MYGVGEKLICCPEGQYPYRLVYIYIYVYIVDRKTDLDKKKTQILCRSEYISLWF